MGISRLEIAAWVDELAPRRYAEEWDNVGLQVGSLDGHTDVVFVGLTPDESMVRAAADAGAKMIVTHHPLIFKALKSVGTMSTDASLARCILESLSRDVSVYACHTNLDVVVGGVNDALAVALELGPESEPRPMKATFEEHLLKLVAYVPVPYLEPVRQALAGVRHIGQVRELHQTIEVRLEATIEEPMVGAALAAIRSAHPHEEIAYDLFSIHRSATPVGLGRQIDLARPLMLDELGATVKGKLGCPWVRVVGDGRTVVRTVAVCGGSGAELIGACAGRVDALVTGDVKYHDALRASELGLCLVDAGHYATEMPGVRALGRWLERKAAAVQAELRVVVYDGLGEPFKLL